MSKKLIFCIVGLPGSGKTTVKDAILKNFDAYGISSGDIIRDEIKRRGLQYSPTTDAIVAQWFHEQGREKIIVERTWEKLKRKRKRILVVDGLRNFVEIEYLGQISGIMPVIIAVTAPFKIRAERELKRGRFGKGETLEYLRQRDKAEIGRGEKKLIRKADYTISTGRLNLKQTEMRTRKLVKRILKRK